MPRLQKTLAGMMAVAVALHEVRRTIESAMGGRALPAWDRAPEGEKTVTLQNVDDAVAGRPVDSLTRAVVEMMLETEDPKPVRRPTVEATPDVAKLLE